MDIKILDEKSIFLEIEIKTFNYGIQRSQTYRSYW